MGGGEECEFFTLKGLRNKNLPCEKNTQIKFARLILIASYVIILIIISPRVISTIIQIHCR